MTLRQHLSMGAPSYRLRNLCVQALFSALLILCADPTQAATAPATAELDEQIRLLFEGFDSEDTPGASIAVARNGEILYADAFGQADIARNIPVTNETQFNAGSIAKQFTAVSILMLEDSGLLSLEDRVGEYVAGLQQDTSNITVEQLLYHTSGVRDFLSLMFLAGWHSDDVRTQDQALRLIKKQTDLNFNPGENFIYSNSNYVLLAEIVTAVTGQPFASWMKENIFSPVGMNDTLIKDDHRLNISDEAESYRKAIGTDDYVRDPLLDSVTGSSNLITTASDLVQWGSYLLQAEVNTESLLDRLLQPPDLPAQVDAGYAAGVFVGEYRGVKTVHHGGTTSGYSSHLLMIPEEGLSIAVLANLNTIPTERLTYQIADVLLSGATPISLVENDAEATPYDPPSFEPYVGLYHLENEMILSVQMMNEQPVYFLGGEVPHPLIPAGNNSFQTPDRQTTITFATREPAQLRLHTVELPLRELTGRRIEPIDLSPREIRDYEGRYYSEELETFYTIAGSRESLTAHHLRGGASFVLHPVGHDYFVEPRAPDLVVQFRRDRFGRVRDFDISVRRARHIMFEKH